MLASRHNDPGPSAAELLEASKKLYVKTDILKVKRLEPGQPRLFVSGPDEDLPRLDPMPSPSGYFSPIPSSYNPLHSPSFVSAFRRVSDCPPPVPPKSEQIREKSRRLYSRPSDPPPPLYPRRALISLRSLPDCSQIGLSLVRHSDSSADRYLTDNQFRPIPKPRLSKMSPLTPSEATVPTPLPRRKTIGHTGDNDDYQTDFSQVQRFHSPLRPDGHMLFSRRSITKSTPNLSGEPRLPHVSSIKRKILAAQGRAATPMLQITQESKMDQYDEEKDFLSAAMRDIDDEYDESEDADNERIPTTSFETPILVSATPRTSPSLTPNLLSPHSGHTLLSPSSPLSAGSDKFSKDVCTPTSKDSGHPSDEEEDSARRKKLTKSVDDGFFDSSGERKTDEESDSSIFTSITNQPKRDDFIESSTETRGRPVSELERKVRVMRWINGCEVSTPL